MTHRRLVKVSITLDACAPDPHGKNPSPGADLYSAHLMGAALPGGAPCRCMT